MDHPHGAELELVAAVVAVAGTTDVARVSKYTGLAGAVVVEALAVLGRDGRSGPETMPDDVRSAVDPVTAAGVHAAVAEDLLLAGPVDVDAVEWHARSAHGLVVTDRIVELADRAGGLAAAVGDPAVAERLFRLADELDVDRDPEVLLARLRGLAEALAGRGRILEAKEVRARAYEIADLCGLVEERAAIAVEHAFPSDWFEGDHRSSALLVRSVDDALAPASRAMLLAARGMVAMRIPVGESTSEQTAWVTRAEVAQPFTDEALRMTVGSSGPDRLVALMAWRATHRSPAFLDGRCEVTREATVLAQSLHRRDRLVEAAVAASVDAHEAADVEAGSEALDMARWFAMSSGDPRLRWYVRMAEAGRCYTRLDLDGARAHRSDGAVDARLCDHPGALAAEVVFAFEEAVTTGDPSVIETLVVDDGSPLLAHPLARAGQALALAHRGEAERALRHIDRGIASVDAESSLLLVLHLLARASVAVGDPERCARLSGLLEPWSDRVVVDAHGWWVGGPVSADLARLALAAGDHAVAAGWWRKAWRDASSLDDRRALDDLQEIRRVVVGERPGVESMLDAAVDAPDPWSLLDERELDVLRLLAAGRTNREIGAELAFSVSTIRMVTMSIYRKLGVSGRPAAAALATAFDPGAGSTGRPTEVGRPVGRS